MTTQPPTRNRILQYIKAHGSAGQAEMSRVMNINKPLLSKTIQRLIASKKLIGHGSTMNRYYTLPTGVATGVGTGVATPVLKVSSPLSETSTTYVATLQPTEKLMLRLHRLQRNYSIAKYDEAALTTLKKVDMNNNTYHQGKGFKITTQHIIIEGYELWSTRTTPAATLEAVAYTLCDNIANAIAAQYKLIIDTSTASSPLNLMEIELTEHDMAERVDQKGKIPLHWDGAHTPDVWMDKSYGLGGLESSKTAYIQKLTDFTNFIVEDRWSAEIQMDFNRDILDILKANARQIGQFAEQMNIHAPVFKAIETIAEHLTPTKQRKVRTAIDALSQTRLGEFQ